MSRRPHRNRSLGRIIAVLRDTPLSFMPTHSVAEALQKDLAKVHMDLVSLEESGRVERVGPGYWKLVPMEGDDGSA